MTELIVLLKLFEYSFVFRFVNPFLCRESLKWNWNRTIWNNCRKKQFKCDVRRPVWVKEWLNNSFRETKCEAKVYVRDSLKTIESILVTFSQIATSCLHIQLMQCIFLHCLLQTGRAFFENALQRRKCIRNWMWQLGLPLLQLLCSIYYYYVCCCCCCLCILL